MSGAIQQMVEDLGTLKVWLWDIGPKKPLPPKRPTVPVGKTGDPEYDLLMVEFKEGLEDYEAALRAYSKAKKGHAEWASKMGGAIELEMWTCDATDALSRDPNRYYISSRTRGHEKTPNRGLPSQVKEGHGQADLERRRAEQDVDLEAARRSDPIFGQQELR
jgi:hypothetical protein